MSLLVLAPCGSIAKDPALLSLGMEHFRDTASVDTDPARGLTTISTEPGFVEHSGLMGMVWHDEFLTAVIDAKTGRTSFRIDVSITYSGARRSYLAVSLAGMNGPTAVVPTLVGTESANCSVGECLYTDHLMIAVDEALLRHLAAAYVPGKPIPLTYTLTPKEAPITAANCPTRKLPGCWPNSTATRPRRRLLLKRRHRPGGWISASAESWFQPRPTRPTERASWWPR